MSKKSLVIDIRKLPQHLDVLSQGFLNGITAWLLTCVFVMLMGPPIVIYFGSTTIEYMCVLICLFLVPGFLVYRRLREYATFWRVVVFGVSFGIGIGLPMLVLMILSEFFPISFEMFWYFAIPIAASCTVLTSLTTWWLLNQFRYQIVLNDGGLCGACGYCIRGVSSGRCPECGQQLALWNETSVTTD